MNYRHAFHAGNFADVHKHVALVSVLLHLRKKDKPFVVIDTHAGRGLYDLTTDESQRTREAEAGIEKVRALETDCGLLNKYLELVRSFGAAVYPGSPLIAASVLRPQDRLIAIEKHPEEFAALAQVLRPYASARAVDGDGYARLLTLLPPPERRGVVLVDPPYEADNESEYLARAFSAAYRRFATGIYLLWFPLKLEAEVRALAGELQVAGASKLLLSTIDVGGGNESGRLTSAGLFIVNPPFGFDAEMCEAAARLLPYLRQGESAKADIQWLSLTR